MAWRARWQTVAAVMIPVYFISILPPSAWAAASDNNSSAPVLTPKNVHVNKRGPKVTPYAGVQLSAKPTDSEITYSHAFAEPLVPVGGQTSSSENQALGAAIKTYLQRKDDENVSVLTSFLDQYPNSAWRPSLDLNLAEVLFRTANFSKALDAWEDAWARTQNLTDTTGQQVANLAAGKLAEMKARIGRTDELVALYKQIKGRNVSGVSAQLLVQARSGLWLMQNRPQDAFRCGPSALQELSLATKNKVNHPEIIKQSRSTPQGIALSDVKALAAKIDMPMQMAKRTAGATFIVPAVIHWKLGHYAALVGQKDGKYIVRDTTFGATQFLISAQALEQETSGYFLVPTGALPTGWTSVAKEEGSKVFGRGNPGLQFAMCTSPNDSNSGDGDCGSGGVGNPGSDPNGAGLGDVNLQLNLDSTTNSGNNNGDSGVPPLDMTVSAVKAMLVSLNLVDTPVGYKPPIGPAMHFTVQYNQREIAQPATFSYANLGPNWTFSYMSYITPNATYATIYERGGGEEIYYNSGTNSYYPAQRSQAVLTQVNSTTWQRTLPGGEVETFGQPDGAGNFFLSQITDPQNNSLTLSYDSHFRLVSLTDAIGQVTTISYVSNTISNAGYYNIAQVTDPFGRSAQFAYDGTGRLQRITDIIGITSQFTYSGATTFVNSLTTPYGVTSFAFGDNSTDPSLGSTRWLETTYPDGNKTRTEYSDSVPTSIISDADSNGIPSGMYPGIYSTNSYMEFRNTYYWDKQAMHDYPRDYTHAQITHWMHTFDINTCSDVEESFKKVNQNRIWYAYSDPSGSGQISSIQGSNTMLAKPTQKGRVIGTGTANSSNTQLYQYQYNAIGKVTQQIDPLLRETDYAYDPTNNIDLLTVKQKNSSSGSGYDLLATYTYNSQHEVLTAIDASGQETRYYYYPNGQLNYVTNAKNQAITYAYTNNYLTSITGPVSGATTSFTYDGFGRVRTMTDSQGYTTTTDYDAMDRPSQVTYPDGTTSQTHYQNLDAQYTRDRLGRLTRYFYNSLRQPIETLDPQGNITTAYWTLSAGLSSIVDPSGHTTAWKYDGQNRVVEKDYPDGTTQKIGYELTTSRALNVTDNNQQVATNTYNMDNTVMNVAYTHATVTTPTVNYTYDPVYPRIHTVGDSVTGTITYNYNTVTGTLGSNMLGSVQTPLATISYSSSGTPLYDELGRSLGQSINDSATGQGLADSLSSVTYDTLGRVATATNPLSGSGSFNYAYLNNTGRVTSVTNPNGQSTVYKYQDSTTTPNEPRLSEIKNLNSSSAIISKFDYGYDAQNQITSWTQQTDSNHPQNWANQYDNEGKLTNVNVTDTVTSAVLHQYAYLYDAVGNRTSEQIDGNVTASSYTDNGNKLNQLTSQSANGKMVFSGNTGTVPSMVTVGGNAATTSYSTNFSGVANVTSGVNTVAVVAKDVNGNTSTNNYQVTTSGSSASYSYDNNGNLLSDGTRTFGWDAKNQLVSIIYNSGTNAGNHTEFTYNGLGQRVKIVERTGTTIGTGTITSTKQYVWTKGGIAEERDGSNNITKRYFGQGEQRISGSTTTNYFYTRDHLGSVREVIGNDGSTIHQRYAYDPFGRQSKVSGSNILNDLDCDFQYAGMYFHATSVLNLTMYRAYNPNIGRWLSRDSSGEGSGLNLYAYCGNNPINYVDVLGIDRTDSQRTSQFIHGAIALVGVVAGAALLVVVAASTAPIIVVVAASGIIIVGITASLIYGEANMASAFSPNTPQGDQMAQIAADLPKSANEIASQIITGKKDVGSGADSILTITTGSKLDKVLDAIDRMLDAIDALNKQSSPASGGSAGCMDSSSYITASSMGLTPDGLRP
jgi:RHS repeat-associated protein